MTLSQLTPLFPGLDLPAILDPLFLKTQAAGHGTQPINYGCGRKNRFLLFLATNRLLYSLPDHISLQLQQPAYVCCRKCPT